MNMNESVIPTMVHHPANDFYGFSAFPDPSKYVPNTNMIIVLILLGVGLFFVGYTAAMIIEDYMNNKHDPLNTPEIESED